MSKDANGLNASRANGNCDRGVSFLSAVCTGEEQEINRQYHLTNFYIIVTSLQSVLPI